MRFFTSPYKYHLNGAGIGCKGLFRPFFMPV
nr:MAG TPA: hypothetical protein [Caudoviricetes sp.]